MVKLLFKLRLVDNQLNIINTWKIEYLTQSDRAVQFITRKTQDAERHLGISGCCL